MNKKVIKEAFKYGVVGVMNTLLTALTIWLIMHFLFYTKEKEAVSSVAISVSNVVGYAVGLLNSFIWNRNWTFKSHHSWKKDFLKFITAFLICYIPQLALVNILNNYADLPSLEYEFLSRSYFITSAYICQLAGIVFFTVFNFLCNKYYTFKK
jgi:putative flippase GtrA